jgi:hypothetical protein
VSQVIDDEVREFVKQELPLVTTLFLKVVEISDNSSLQGVYEPEDIAEMMEKYFQWFDVTPDSFSLHNYFPWEKKSIFSGNPVNAGKKPLTISMLIESAKAGCWIY